MSLPEQEDDDENKNAISNDIIDSEAHKILAIEIWEIISNSNSHPSTLLHKESVLSWISLIKTSNYYFNIHLNYDQSNIKMLNHFTDNIKYLYKPWLYTLKKSIAFDVQLYKYGETFSSSLRKRFGIITRYNLFSSNKPLKEFEEKKAKDKTKYVINAEIIKELYNPDDKVTHWSDTSLKFRINIWYQNEKGINRSYFLYTDSQSKLNNWYDIVTAIQMYNNKGFDSNGLILEIRNVIIQSHITYTMLKLVAVKNQRKNDEKIKEYFNNEIINKDKTCYRDFISKLNQNWEKLYNKQKEYRIYSDWMSIICPYKKENFIIKKDISVDLLENCVKIIKSKLPMPRRNKKYKHKFIDFKLPDNELLKISWKNISMLFTDNKENSFKCEDIGEITNIAFNYKHDHHGYGLMIYGPKINPTIPLSFTYNNIPDEIFYDFVEGPTSSYQSLIWQIFHVILSKDDIRSDIANMHIFFEISQDVPNTLTSKIINSNIVTNVKSYNDNYIVLELNKEYTLDQSWLSNPIKITLFSINKLWLDKNTLKDYNTWKYITKHEIGSIEVTLNQLKNSMNEFKWNTLSNQSKIILNAFPIELAGNACSDYQKYSFYLSNNFYLIETLTPNKINSLYNDTSIPWYIRNYYYNIKQTPNKKYFYLGMNSQIESSILISALNNSQEDFENIQFNSKFHFIPKCKLDERNNLVFTAKEIITTQLCKYLGISNKHEILYFNYFTNEIKSLKYNANYFQVTKINSFNVIDMNQISNINIDEGDHADNYKWKRFIPCTNESQMLALVELLKQLRNRANNSIYDNTWNRNNENKNNHEIDIQRIVNEEEKKWKNNLNNKILNIIVEKVEFKRSFKIDSDVTIGFSFTKEKKSSTNDLSRGLLESFVEEELKYKNTILTNNKSLRSLYTKLMNQKGNAKTVPNKYPFDQTSFNSGNMCLNLNTFPNNEREVNFTINVWLDKFISANVIMDFGNNQCISLSSELSWNEMIGNKRHNADYMILPLFALNNSNGNKEIIGIFEVKVMLLEENNEGKGDFNVEFNRKIIECYHRNFDKFNEFMIYEPNVYKRVCMQKINREIKGNLKDVVKNPDLRNQLISWLAINGVRYSQKNNTEIKCDYVWDISRERMNLKVLRTITKIWLHEKREEFYMIFLNYEWDVLWKNKDIEKYLPQKTSKETETLSSLSNHSLNPGGIVACFPDYDNMKKLKKENDQLYLKIKSLIYQGLPTINSRKIIWNKLLNIPKLFELTAKSFKSYKFNNYGDVYTFFLTISKSSTNNTVVDSFIDNDINYVQFQNSLLSSKTNISIIKSIVKAFFQWTKIKVSFNPQPIYLYFKQILILTSRWFNIFHSPSEVFWFIIGLSQVIDAFSLQTIDNLNNTMNTYLLIVKLILKVHHPSIYKKLLLLSSFNTWDIFLYDRWSSLFSNCFNDELCIRLLDILVFESTLNKTFDDWYDNDQLNYLRVQCNISITTWVLNEKLIWAVTSWEEMEEIFQYIFNNKHYKNQTFISVLHENIDKFFLNKNWLDIWFGLNQNKRTVWDKDKNSYFELLYNDYISVINKEKEKYGKEIIDIVNQNNEDDLSVWDKAINNGKEVMIRKWEVLYTQSNKKKIGLVFSVNKIFNNTFNNTNTNMKYQIEGGFTDDANSNKYNSCFNVTIETNQNGTVVDKDNKNVNVLNTTGKNNLYLILNYNSAKGNEWNAVKININNWSYYTPITIQLLSTPSNTVIEISIMKYLELTISNEQSDVFLSLYSHSDYSSSIPYYQKFVSFHSTAPAVIKSKCKDLEEISNLSNKLDPVSSYLIASTLTNTKWTNHKILNGNKRDQYSMLIQNKIVDILNDLLPYPKLSALAVNWYINSNMNFTIFEIVCFIFLRSSNLNIFKAWYVIYYLTTLSDINNVCSLSSLEDTVYSLYKIYSVKYNYNEINTMIRCKLKVSNRTIKCVFVYKKDSLNNIIDYLLEHNIYTKSVSNQIKNGEMPYYDITYDYMTYWDYYDTIKDKNPNTDIEIFKQILQNNKKIFELNYDSIVIERVNEYDNSEIHYSFDKSGKVIKLKNSDERSVQEISNVYEKLWCYGRDITSHSAFYYREGITFEVFKNVIFTLPFLSDALCSEYFRSTLNTIKTPSIAYDNIIINITNSFNPIYKIQFISNVNVNAQKSSPNIWTIKYNINQENTVQDLYTIVMNKLLYMKWDIQDGDVVKEWWSNEKDWHFYVVSEKVVNYIPIGIPIYMWEYVNVRNIIEIGVDIAKDFTNNMRTGTIKHGYYKHYWNMFDGYQWRKCKLIWKDDKTESNYSIEDECCLQGKLRKEVKDWSDLWVVD